MVLRGSPLDKPGEGKYVDNFDDIFEEGLLVEPTWLRWGMAGSLAVSGALWSTILYYFVL